MRTVWRKAGLQTKSSSMVLGPLYQGNQIFIRTNRKQTTSEMIDIGLESLGLTHTVFDPDEVEKQVDELIKRLNIEKEVASNKIKREDLRKVMKFKLEGLKRAKEGGLEEYNKDMAACKEIEESIFKPVEITIQPTVEETVDTKNHPFVYDHYGSKIFTTITRLRARTQAADDLVHKYFKPEDMIMDPEKVAEVLKKSQPELILQSEAQPKPTEDELEEAFGGEHPLVYTPPWRLNKNLTEEEMKAERLRCVTEGTNITPNSEGYDEFVKMINGVSSEVHPALAAFEAVATKENERRRTLRSVAATASSIPLTDEEIKKINSADMNEHVDFNKAVHAFLNNSKEPSNDQKLTFMHQQRQLFKKQREEKGVVDIVRRLIATPKVFTDSDLVAIFDKEATAPLIQLS